MRRFPMTICVMVLVASMAVNAAAEKTVAVNDPAIPGVFDQPSATVSGSGSIVHVAYIGANTTAGPFRVYYAAIDGNSDFTNLSLSRTTAGFLVTSPTPVDNTAPGNDTYVDARHPRIATISDTDVVIFFQAKTAASPDPTYVLYLARLTLENGVVVNQSVRIVTGLSGFTEDVSFALVTSDDTARVAYSGRPGISGDFNVYYAKISLETAAVTGTPGTPLLLSSAAGSTGTRPLPNLNLDSSTRSHIAWAANDNSVSPNGIYYALVKETDGADTVAIAATELLGRSRKWGFPAALVSTTTSIIILAYDESVPGTAGNIGMVNINPDADDQDGSPVQVTTDTNFLLNPPGEAILPESFSVYRPEAFIDGLSQIHITGYGNNGTRSTYYDFTLLSTSPFAQFKNNPVTVGLDSSEFPVSLNGDYTRAAIGFMTAGKVLIFWSGEVAGTGNRNLDVIGLPTASAIVTDETGCGVVAKSGAGGAGRNADGLFLVLPLAILWMRRVLRRSLAC
jgi:hypothetical protein